MEIKSYTAKQLPESKPVAASGSLERACYAAGERVMAKHARWGWIPATVRWQSETAVSLETDHHYLITVPLEDVKPHNDKVSDAPDSAAPNRKPTL